MLLLILFGLDCVTGDGQFECGEHGRFEYCIDEIPGCVIGCHCHPGYYFDTDTKICEPNIKLTQNYRRYYTNTEEPPDVEMLPKESEVTVPTSTMDPIDNQVDEITKNADDLGDWLYNQFFKTIENQVINKTDGKTGPTRRIGTSPFIVKNLSRRKMSRKKRKRSKQRKKKAMRRKLLRITENDSVFDSMSEESQSDSSDSTSDDSDETFEIEQGEDKHSTDKEHGHKKIVIINKKPKPPLPSFIFLPNMDTPFYPPIGLPPPPIMPMYPLVPVPPMPAFPCPDQEECGGSTAAPSMTISTSGTIQTTLMSTTKEESTSLGTTIEEKSTEPSADSGKTENPPPSNVVRANRHKKRNRAPRFKQRKIGGNPYPGFTNPVNENREKILQRLRHKIQNPVPMRQPIEQEENTEYSFFENDEFDETFNNEIQSSNKRRPKLDNVDFKYMSELIHRVDRNNSRNPLEYNPNDSIEVYKPSKQHIISTEDLNKAKETRRGETDDSYYTHLGRQIASIIRSADAENQQVNIEIEQTNQNNENHVFFNDNSPKSFWERSVRSPIKFLNSNKNRYDYLKKSNELLFDIENKVSIMASTVPSLSLREIENIVNVMEKTQRKIKNKQINLNKLQTSNKNLNFNLWPQENQLLKNNLNKIVPIVNSEQVNNFKKLPELHGVSMQNFHRFTAWLSTGQNNRTLNNNKEPLKNTFKSMMGTERKQSNIKTHLPTSPIQAQLMHQKSSNSSFPLTPMLQRQALYSMLPNYKHMERNKYFQDSSNVGGDDGFLFRMKPVHQLINKPIDQQPSYFHHDINHFHYFE